jgi:hypothetical protein
VKLTLSSSLLRINIILNSLFLNIFILTILLKSRHTEHLNPETVKIQVTVTLILVLYGRETLSLAVDEEYT